MSAGACVRGQEPRWRGAPSALHRAAGHIEMDRALKTMDSAQPPAGCARATPFHRPPPPGGGLSLFRSVTDLETFKTTVPVPRCDPAARSGGTGIPELRVSQEPAALATFWATEKAHLLLFQVRDGRSNPLGIRLHRWPRGAVGPGSHLCGCSEGWRGRADSQSLPPAPTSESGFQVGALQEPAMVRTA